MNEELINLFLKNKNFQTLDDYFNSKKGNWGSLSSDEIFDCFKLLYAIADDNHHLAKYYFNKIDFNQIPEVRRNQFFFIKKKISFKEFLDCAERKKNELIQ